MRWFNDKQTNYRSSLIPYELFAINEEVYDEIVTKEDGIYLIKRCGTKPATLGHGEEVYITDGKRIIYPLPLSEVREIKLDWIPPTLLGEFSRLGLTVESTPIMEGMAKVDRRYIEDRKIERAYDFRKIDKETLNTRVPIFLKTIYGNEKGVGTLNPNGKYYVKINLYNNFLKVRQIEICIENQLFANDYIKWNNVINKYQLYQNGDIINLEIDKVEIKLNEEEDRIVTEGNFDIDLYIPTKTLRPLEMPSNISIYNRGLKKGVKWDHVIGAESYEVYLNDKLMEETEYNGYVSEKEFEGFMKIRALNEFLESEFTESFYIKSVPNEPFEAHLDNYIENNEHVFKISFADYSEIETNYRIRYSVDGRQEEIIDLPASEGMGTIYNHIIRIPNINEYFGINVTAVNEIGEAEIVKPIIRYIVDQPRWTFKKQSNEVLMEWTHLVEDAVRYKIIMEKDGEIFDDYVPVDVTVGASMRYTTELSPTSTMKVMILPIDREGNNHIYTKPVTMSMATDKTLASMTLVHNKLSETEHEFIWDDIYDCEKEFEVVYSVSGGTVKREIITSSSSIGTGRKYRFNFTFEEHGFINVKVRMNWDLGSSDYSNEVTVYHIPSSGLPPAYIRRNRVGDNINILWEGQEYVKDYDLLIRRGRDEDKIITVADNSYLYNLPVPIVTSPAGLTAQEKNKWKLIRYPNTNAVGNSPDWGWIEGLTPLDERIVSDHLINETEMFGNQYVGHFTTHLFLDEDYLIETRIKADDRATLWLNGKKIVSGVNSWTKCNLDLKAGWNTVDVLLLEVGGSDYFVFENGMRLSTHPAIRTMTNEDRFLKASNDRMEFRVRTRFLNGVVSEYTEPMIFTPDATAAETMGINITPTKVEEIVNTTNVDLGTTEKYDLVTKSSSQVSTWYTPYTRIITRHTMAEFPQEAEIRGTALRTVSPLESSIILKNSNQFIGKYNQLTTTPEEAYVPIGTYIKTMINQPYQVYTEVNKVTIVCIGDSITSGHPGWWAETGTGDIRSQYEYWLDIRLKGQFNIINKGYGSDTTDDILARFEKDVLGYNAQYCIIQGGTNDLYWAMAEASGDKAYLDGKVTQMKNNIEQMVRRCWDNGIVPIVGTLIPRTGATGIYKDALYEYNEWIINFCTGNDNIFYVDFFNAGKEKIPPTPLEDPANPGAMNPIYDGDAIYDDYGNLIKQGRGIHPNWEGYRIMGECIPLNIFKTGETGLKLYLDKECTVEETYNDDDKVNPFYSIDIDGVRRGVPKKLIRYVKNVGTNQQLFAAYSYNNYNIDVKFLDENGRRMDYANGLLPASAVARIEMRFDVHKEDSKASVNLYLASREFKVG